MPKLPDWPHSLLSICSTAAAPRLGACATGRAERHESGLQSVTPNTAKIAVTQSHLLGLRLANRCDWRSRAAVVVAHRRSRQVTLSNAPLAKQNTTGSIGQPPVVDILRDIEQAAQDARVWFETECGMGEVLCHRGRMVKARLGGARGQTALLRLLAINDGRYGIEYCAVEDELAIIENVSALVDLHNLRKSEWKDLCGQAPPLGSIVRLTAAGADVRDSARGIQRVILVLIDGRRTLMQVLEESSFDPVEALKIVIKAIDDDLAQIAIQTPSLFPIAPTGETSGVLPRFTTSEAIPRQHPTALGLDDGPPSWRHATLVGLGSNGAKPIATKSSDAVSSAVELGGDHHESAESDTTDAPVVTSLVKTIVGNFRVRRQGNASRTMPNVGDNNSGNPQHESNNKNAPRQRIIDVTAVPTSSTEDSPVTRKGFSVESVPAAAPIPAADGQRRYVDRYEILLRIGRGGMGTVYLCRLDSANVGFRRLFALKLLRNHLSSDTEAATDFLEEARVAGQLHHANIVAVYDAGFHGKQPYLVMDYVEGCSFKHLMKSLPTRAPHLILPIIIDALAGLHAAHTLQDEFGTDLNLVHCDVSPENLLVGVDGTCRLTDFGIARRASRVLGTVTRGKPGYVAPEQVTGQKFDRRADIFSMGVVLWGALTGTRLFEGNTTEETIEQVRKKTIPLPSAAGAQSSPVLDDIVMRALSRNPNQRFDSAEEMLTALGRVALNSDGPATPKEIASWVREASGAELTQRRLAILDAARSNPTIPPPAESPLATDIQGATSLDLTHTVMTSDIVSSVSVNPSQHAEVVASPARFAESDAPSPKSGPPELPSCPASSISDVSSLFYGKDEIARMRERSESPGSVSAVSISSGPRATFGVTVHRKWLLFAVVALTIGIATFLAFRSKSPKSAPITGSEPYRERRIQS